MVGIGIGLSTRLGGGSAVSDFTASATGFPATLAAGQPIAILRDPFADTGTTYATFGTVPAQLALSGGSIVAGSGAASVGNTYAIGVLATSGNGKRKRGETFVFTAQAGSATLAALTLSTLSAVAGQLWTATLGGRTAGSAIGATSGDGGTVTVAGDSVSATFAAAGTVSVSLVETLAGAAGSPRTTMLAVTVAAAPAGPAALLMTGRLVQPGFNGYAGSDGTDTDSNSRLSFFNETAAPVTRLRTYFPNWMATATSESNAFNPIAITAAIEYPAGTVTPLAFAGSTTTTIANGALAESDELVLAAAIPADAQFWVRTYVSVGAGLKWPQGYQVSSTRGEAADFSTAVDRSASGAAITNASPTTRRRAYGPAAIKATQFGAMPRAVALALIGDSTVMGSTDGSSDPRGNTGYPARACAGLVPAINMGIAGTKAADNGAGPFAMRLNLLAKAGVTHAYCAYSQNDVAAGRSLATMQADLTAVWQMLAGVGLKVIAATSLPRSSSGNGFVTVAGQVPVTSPANAFEGGAASKRSQLNAWMRTLPAPLWRVFDVADALETARDSGVWRAGDGSPYLTASGAATDAATTDGIHPSVTAASRGGIYIARDAMAAAIPGW